MQAVKRIIPWVVAFAMLMETLDATVINTALPQIALSLHQDPLHLKLALTSYLLSLGVFIPISGWLADRFGAKRIFSMAITVFTLSSMGCGMAHSLQQLVIMRIFQGVGGAMMMPVGRLILLRLFDKSELVKVLSRVVMFALVGPVIGPTLGGFFTEYLSWRWAFYINLPIGIAGVALVLAYLQNDGHVHREPFDYRGFLLFGAGMALLLFAFQMLPGSNMPVLAKLGYVAAGLLSLGAYYFHAKHHSAPAVNLTLFHNRIYRITAVGGFVSRLGIGAMPFLLPLMYQVGMNYSPFIAGLLMAPMAIGAMSVKSLVKSILKRYGFRRTLLVNTALLGLMAWQFIWVSPHLHPWTLVIMMFVYGCLMSLQFSCMNILLYADMAPKMLSTATSMASMLQQISVSFGIAITALLLELLLGASDLSINIPLPYFHYAFAYVGALILLSSVFFARLQAADGVAISGHQSA